MNFVWCGSAALTEQPEVTARGYRRFRCRACGRQFNERSVGVLNRTCLPSDIIAFMVFCRLRYRLTLRDLGSHHGTGRVSTVGGVKREYGHAAVASGSADIPGSGLNPSVSNALLAPHR